MTKLLLNTGHDITRLDWPGNSPELKLIEALWVIVKKAEGRKVTVGFISQERELNVPKMKKKKKAKNHHTSNRFPMQEYK